jgi:glycosyltransferase involved in cell wall biosynthesis
MTHTPRISVIVPVYQAEKYISRCLDSILAQSFTDFEVLMIDDGSRDNGGKICDDYAKKDGRFHVVHKKNEGVSIARQTGLDMAQGEYVIHADPDDWVEPDWLGKLYQKIVEDRTDIVICDYEHIKADETVIMVQRPASLHKDDVLEALLDGVLWGSLWNKLVRRDCFSRYGVSFHPDMNLHEDLFVNCLLIVYGATVSFLPEVLYHYDNTINENSITMHRKDSHIRSMMIFIDQFSPILSDIRFDNGWFLRKYLVKEDIFKNRINKYDIKNTYGEINERIIRETKNYAHSSIQRNVAVCLQTNLFIGHLHYYLMNKLKRMKQFLSGHDIFKK